MTKAQCKCRREFRVNSNIAYDIRTKFAQMIDANQLN